MPTKKIPIKTVFEEKAIKAVKKTVKGPAAKKSVKAIHKAANSPEAKKLEKNLETFKDYYDDYAKEAKKVGQEFMVKVKEMKDKYDHMDDETKNNIKAGVAGAMAFLAGAAVAHKMDRKKKASYKKY